MTKFFKHFNPSKSFKNKIKPQPQALKFKDQFFCQNQAFKTYKLFHTCLAQKTQKRTKIEYLRNYELPLKEVFYRQIDLKTDEAKPPMQRKNRKKLVNTIEMQRKKGFFDDIDDELQVRDFSGHLISLEDYKKISPRNLDDLRPIYPQRPVNEVLFDEKMSDKITAKGRRKKANAVVVISKGSGRFIVNEKLLPNYFTRLSDRAKAIEPLLEMGISREYDVICSVMGGGMSGKAQAVRSGLAKALKMINYGRWNRLKLESVPAINFYTGPKNKNDENLSRLELLAINDPRHHESKALGRVRARKKHHYVRR